MSEIDNVQTAPEPQSTTTEPEQHDNPESNIQEPEGTPPVQTTTGQGTTGQIDTGNLMAALQNFLDGLRQREEQERRDEETKNMTPEQRLEYDRKQFENQRNEELKKIKIQANKIYAVQKVIENKFPQSHSEAIVNIVMADDEKTIEANVMALRKLVDEISRAEIEAKFKEAGYNPKNGKGGQAKTSVGEEIAKAMNEAATKKSEYDPWA